MITEFYLHLKLYLESYPLIPSSTRKLKEKIEKEKLVEQTESIK